MSPKGRKSIVRVFPFNFRAFLPALALFVVVVLASASATAQRFGAAGQAPSAAKPATGQPQGQGTPRPGSSQRTTSAEDFLRGRFEPFWKDEAQRKEIGLSDNQVRDISRLFDNRVKLVTPYWEELQKQSAELDRLFRERTADDTVFAIQVSRVEALRSKVNETRTLMLYQVYKRLTPPQYQKLQEIRDRQMGRRGGAPLGRSW
jgi:hypothetical protein